MSRNQRKDVIESTLRSIQQPLSTTQSQKLKKVKAIYDNIQKDRDAYYRFFNFEEKKIKKALKKFSGQSKTGSYWRAVYDDYGNKPLSSVGGTKSITRFNYFQPCIYLGETSQTASKEVRLEISKSAFLFLCIDFQLTNIIDLSTKTKCSRYGVDFDLMMGHWEVFKNIKKSGRGMRYYSQYVAKAVRESSIEAILYSSKQHKGKKCLVIFTENLKKTSNLKVKKPAARVKKADSILIGKK